MVDRTIGSNGSALNGESAAYDVVVIGAGPAGCSAAAVAARRGLRVLLLERDREPRFKLGESLMPESYSSLRAMGALDRMKSSGFTEKHSVQFFTKSGRASAPFYFASLKPDDSARTWQVLRADFDQLLLEVAGEAGAECRRGVRVREVLFEGERAVGVRVEEDGARREISARVVVDASGLNTVLARHLSLGRVDYGLDHASVYTHFRGAFRDPGIDEGATLILHTATGQTWFWYIPMAGDLVSVGVVGKVSDLISARSSRPHETFFDEVRKCPEIERRIAGARQCRPVMVAKDFSYRCDRMSGDGWVLIGDAFSFIDPVYSSGVFLALKSGELAAEAIADGIDRGDLSAAQLGSFRPRLMHGVEAIRKLVESFYAPDFSFGEFLKAYPHHQNNVTRILIGDVLDPYFGDLFDSMAEFRNTLLPTGAMAKQQIAALSGN